MGDERTACAEAALRTERGPRGWGISVGDLLSQENGHHFFEGWHIGWKWGVDEDGRTFLDLLSEHRHPGMSASRYFSDGTSEAFDTPGEFRLMGKTPEEDAELERSYFEYNRQAYAGLRERGLLPPPSANLRSQDINEFLRSGGDTTDPSDD